MDSASGSSAVCDTARSPRVTSSRSYRTFKPALLSHEETLAMWWQGPDDFERWMRVNSMCEGAAIGVVEYSYGERALRAALDFAEAGRLATYRAILAPPVTLRDPELSQAGGES